MFSIFCKLLLFDWQLMNKPFWGYKLSKYHKEVKRVKFDAATWYIEPTKGEIEPISSNRIGFVLKIEFKLLFMSIESNFSARFVKYFITFKA